MTVSAVTEYNPFHNGHKFHIEASKAVSGSEYFTAVMSGNFTQRGEPAIFDKFNRARAALLNGADLCLELPCLYACASAEYFARGAVKIIKSSGVSDCLSFGAETDDIDGLDSLACFFIRNGEKYNAALKKYLQTGLSYPAARKRAAADSGAGDRAGLLNTPNNILAIEYLKAIRSLGYETRAIAIKRDSDHNSETLSPGFSSAAALRSAIHAGETFKISDGVPRGAYEIYTAALENGDGPYHINNLSRILHYVINERGESYAKNIFEASEGLGERVASLAGKRFYIADIISEIKTKRYTFTKINRIILHLMLNILKDDYEFFEANGGPQYIRVLGFKKSSEKLLSALVKKSALPVVINLKDDMKKLPPAAVMMLKNEIAAGDVFRLANSCANDKFLEKGFEYRQPVVVV